MKLKKKLLLIIINILLLKNLIKITSENFAARLALENLASKTNIPDITDFVEKTDCDNKLIRFDKRITSNKIRDIENKTKLDDLESKVKIISTKGLKADLINKYSILNGAKYFSSNTLQNYLVSMSTKYSIAYIGNANKINSRDSKGMLRESINNPYTSDTNFSPRSPDGKNI